MCYKAGFSTYSLENTNKFDDASVSLDDEDIEVRRRCPRMTSFSATESTNKTSKNKYSMDN